MAAAARNAKPVAIAGGGIGGLACALALARHGFRSLVLEQAPAFGEVGVGLHVAPNALSVLDALGVGAAAKKNALMIERLLMMDAVTGEEVVNIPCDERFEQRFGNPYAVAHRAHIHGPLLDACRAHDLVELRTDCRVIGFEQAGVGVSVLREAGEPIAAAALVGADGVYSNVRQRIVGDGDPQPAGAVIYRATIPAADMPKDLQHPYPTFWAGPDWHIIYYPISDWTMFNFGCTVAHRANRPGRERGVSPRRRAAAVSRKLRDAAAGAAHPEELPPLHRPCTASRWRTGPWELRRCSAMPRIRWCNTSRRARRWRWRTQSASAAAANECDGDFARAFQRYQDIRIVRTARVQISSLMMIEAQPRQGRRAEGAQFAVRRPHRRRNSTTAWPGSTPRRPM